MVIRVTVWHGAEGINTENTVLVLLSFVLLLLLLVCDFCISHMT